MATAGVHSDLSLCERATSPPIHSQCHRSLFAAQRIPERRVATTWQSGHPADSSHSVRAGLPLRVREREEKEYDFRSLNCCFTLGKELELLSLDCWGPIIMNPSSPESSVKMMLFGGAISCSFPARFKDVGDVRQVPNNQEAYVDSNRDESLIIELLELKDNVADTGSARWFLEDLAVEQASGNSLVLEEESIVPPADVPNVDANTTVNAVVGTMAVAKGRQGPEASNLVRVYLANIRLRGVETDILVTVYEPLAISEQSESAGAVGAGPTVPATVAGCMPAADVFKKILSTFTIHDWTLFGYEDE